MGAQAVLALALVGQNPGWPAHDVDLPPASLMRPERMPGDPDFAPSADPGRGCRGQLALYSFTPTCAQSLDAAEAEKGVGIAADRAWLLTRGDPSISGAIVGAGFDLSDRELLGRVRLSAGELPAPLVAGMRGPHDRNRDGAFTVQDFTSATGTTAPTVDTVIDEVLLARADHGDANHNGLLDPGDLLSVFADGVDDDGNGFIDDIAGWDFVDNDNDPGIAGQIGVAARALVGEANNGIGGAGVCPRCTIVPIRARSEWVAKAETLALGLRYAAKNGVAVAVAVAADYGQNTLDLALREAAQLGTLVIASAGQHGSLAPTPDLDGAFLVGAIDFDHHDIRQASTAFHPMLEASRPLGAQTYAPGPGAEIYAAGAALLARSAALGLPDSGVARLDPTLSAGELGRLLEATLVRAKGDSREPGRVDARRAIDLVVRKTIPPEIALLSPKTGDLLDPGAGRFGVRGHISNQRHKQISWVLEAALGATPPAEAFAAIASGQVEGLGSFDIDAEVKTTGMFRDPVAPPSGAYSFALTLRLTASAGALSQSEVRSVVYVHRDLDLLPAYPVPIAAHLATAPRFFDGDGDGADELYQATTEGTLERRDAHGASAAGFPIHSPGDEPFVGGPSIAPLHAGGAAALALVTSGGQLVVVDASGAAAPGFPVALRGDQRQTRYFAPAIRDLDGDGQAELVVVASHGDVWVLEPDGRLRAGFPVHLEGPLSAPAVGAPSGGGPPEIWIAGRDRLWRLRSDGSARSIPFPEMPPRLLVEIPNPPILSPLGAALAPIGGQSLLVSGQGAVTPLGLSGRQAFGARSTLVRLGPALTPRSSSPAMVDLDTDGALDLLAETTTTDTTAVELGTALAPSLSAWSTQGGNQLNAYPIETRAKALSSFAIADIDGDERLEVLFADDDERLVAWSSDGLSPRRWPKLLAGPIAEGPAIGAMLDDDHYTVAASNTRGLLFAWRATGAAHHRVAWDGPRHDLAATGDLSVETRVRSRAAQSPSSCAATSGATGLFTMLLGLSWLLRRRTR